MPALDLDGLRDLYARVTAVPGAAEARGEAAPARSAERGQSAPVPAGSEAPEPLAAGSGPASGAASAAPAPAAPFLRRAAAIVWKDFTVERRTKEGINAMLFFAALVLFIFAFALGPDRTRLREAAPGLLWLAFVFTGVLGLARGFQAEREHDALEGLLGYPGDKGAIYLGKLLGNLLFVGSVELLVVPLMGVFYNLDLWGVAPALLGVALLGTIGFAALGTLYSALTVNLRFREVLLPLLLFPATVPVLLGGVEATAALIRDGTLGPAARWIGMLVAFDAVYLTACLLLFEYVIED
jgi:heme exporter protein B